MIGWFDRLLRREDETPFPFDAGARLIHDVLGDRGYDRDVVEERIKAYPYDLWFDFVGPMLDDAERALFTQEERNEIWPRK